MRSFQDSAFGARILLILIFSISLMCWGCKNEIDRDSLPMYVQNIAGVERIQELMSTGTEQPGLRLAALQLVVQKGLSSELPKLISKAPDGKDLAVKLTKSLLPMVKGDADGAAYARDALVKLLSLVPNDIGDQIRKTISTWAFEGLDENTPKDKLKEQVESRLPASQLRRMGKFGIHGAGLVIRWGFNVTDLGAMLVDLKTPEAKRTLAESLLAAHKNIDSSWTIDQLRFMNEAGHAVGFVEMLRQYRNPDLDEVAHNWAFNAAMAGVSEALKDPKLKDEALNELRSVVASDNPDDKWIGMSTLVEYLGDEGVDYALNGLTEGVTYAYAEEDPRKSMVDFCSDTFVKYAKNSKAKVLGLLTTGNLPQKALGVVCAKVWTDKNSVGALHAMVRAKDSPALEDVLPDVPSLSALARNALDGMALLDSITAKEKSNAMSKEEAKSRRFWVKVVLDRVEPDYSAAVDSAATEDLKEGSN
jgi:hypothetical protein